MKSLRVTLQLHSPFGVNPQSLRHALIWSCDDKDCIIWLDPIASDDPVAILKIAIDQLQQSLISQLNLRSIKAQHMVLQASWRLVLPRGLYHHTRRGPGRWNLTKRIACASDIEDVCPVPLEQLAASSIVLDDQQVWVAGILKDELDSWLMAAKEHKIIWEGIWTWAGALVEGILEYSSIGQVAHYQWQCGHQLIAIESTQESEKKFHVHVRIITDGESQSSLPWQTIAGAELASRFPDTPPEIYPGVLAHGLEQIDVSESINFAIEQHAVKQKTPPGHRPLIRALYMASLATILLAGAFQLRRLLEMRITSQLTQEIRQVWQSARMNSPLAVSPVSTLEQQANIWTNIRTQQTLGLDHPKIKALWASLAAHIPQDIKLQVTSLRIRGTEIVIEGQTLNQFDARKIETAWTGITGITWEPMRLSTASSGMVGFTIRGGIK